MHRFLVTVLMIVSSTSLCAADGPGFDRHFTAKALRVDLFHTGTADEEVFSLDELIEEPYWAGNPNSLIDTLNLGGYLVRVFDLKTNTVIFSRGYCTLFGEWATTDEAIGGFARTFHESIILPFPKQPVQIRIDRRDRWNIFRNI